MSSENWRLIADGAAWACALVPLSTAATILVRSRVVRGAQHVRAIALEGALLALAFGVLLVLAVHLAGPQAGARSWNLLNADALGACAALFAACVWPAVIHAGRLSDGRWPVALYAALLALESSMLLTVLADSLFLYIASLQMCGLLAFVIFRGWSGEGAQPAARKFLAFHLCGDALILIGVIGLAIAGARLASIGESGARLHPYSIAGLTRELPRMVVEDVLAQEHWGHAGRWVLVALLFGLAIKTPIPPFHSWFSVCCLDGPACLALAWTSAGLRLGVYSLVRFIAPLTPGTVEGNSLLMALVLLGAVHSALVALSQDDMRRMAAFAGLSQSTLAAAALFAVQPAAGTASMLWAIGSGVGVALVMFAVNSLELRCGVREISAYGGIARADARLATALTLGALTIVGVPGLAGFAGLYRVLGATFGISLGCASLAAVSLLLVGWALVWMLQRVVQGPLRMPDAVYDAGSPGEGNRFERVIAAPLLFAIILAGLAPQVVVNAIAPAKAVAVAQSAAVNPSAVGKR